MEAIVHVDLAAFGAPALRLDHVHDQLGSLEERLLLGEDLEGEMERIFDGLGHDADGKRDLEHAGGAGFAGCLRHAVHDAGHDA